jgi:hypothetical protein
VVETTHWGHWRDALTPLISIRLQSVASFQLRHQFQISLHLPLLINMLSLDLSAVATSCAKYATCPSPILIFSSKSHFNRYSSCADEHFQQASQSTSSAIQMCCSWLSFQRICVKERPRSPRDDLSQGSHFKCRHVRLSSPKLPVRQRRVSQERQLQSTHPETTPPSLTFTNSITHPSPPRRPSISNIEFERQREIRIASWTTILCKYFLNVEVISRSRRKRRRRII